MRKTKNKQLLKKNTVKIKKGGAIANTGSVKANIDKEEAFSRAFRRQTRGEWNNLHRTLKNGSHHTTRPTRISPIRVYRAPKLNNLDITSNKSDILETLSLTDPRIFKTNMENSYHEENFRNIVRAHDILIRLRDLGNAPTPEANTLDKEKDLIIKLESLIKYLVSQKSLLYNKIVHYKEKYHIDNIVKIEIKYGMIITFLNSILSGIMNKSIEDNDYHKLNATVTAFSELAPIIAGIKTNFNSKQNANQDNIDLMDRLPQEFSDKCQELNEIIDILFLLYPEKFKKTNKVIIRPSNFMKNKSP